MSDDMWLDVLIESEAVFDGVLAHFGVPVRGLDRWHAAFRTVRRFREAKQDASDKGLDSIPPYSESDSARVEVLHAMHDIWDLVPALRGITSEKNEHKLVQDKLRILLTGPVGRTQAAGVARGRDVLFELTMLAELRGAGMDVRLMEPNPDIRVKAPGGTYDIECKRITGYSVGAFTDNLHKASKQIVKHLPDGHKGVLAISITDYMTQGEVMLRGATDADISAAMRKNNQAFLGAHTAIWENPKVVDPKIVGIIFDCSYLAATDHQSIPHNAVQPLLAVTGPHSSSFVADFSRMHNPANGGRDFQEGLDLYMAAA